MTFILRRSQNNRNVPLGKFKLVGKNVHRIDYDVDEDDPDSIYQIYPGDENCTFYALEEGQILIVYCVVDGKPIQCATHNMHDQYVYFEAPPHTSSVLVVVAQSVEESEKALSKIFLL